MTWLIYTTSAARRPWQGPRRSVHEPCLHTPDPPAPSLAHQVVFDINGQILEMCLEHQAKPRSEGPLEAKRREFAAFDSMSGDAQGNHRDLGKAEFLGRRWKDDMLGRLMFVLTRVSRQLRCSCWNCFLALELWIIGLHDLYTQVGPLSTV